ncbi:DASS family sodium-coupled anion symporter [Halorhodospira sp. 9621]|uniref:SLC13 family permease n=1 Tax=Halorhodospira TaxID=85108 RepID=UPI001911715D|nr:MULTISPECIES: DASS family sodium-coupled anion symporter [Halorhodospira]MBK5942768.1 anion transporter [Halorhodospira halophila]MCG5534053.1 DASS family sodium-coupled anion symporter [Halorhodospira sp. 9621]MCG5539361.1 DASS family sodium-coupled anion symporter [Halorhodospira sp. 9622]
MSKSTNPGATRRRWIGLIGGPLAAGGMLLAGPPAGLGQDAWFVAALTVLMATWWVSEALPIAATALLPAAALPLLGVSSPEQTMAAYANPMIFLFLGGFLIAMAIQRWGLHRRIALLILSATGGRDDLLVAGFMGATALLSMWVSNTATAAMMLPIGLSVIGLVESSSGKTDRHFTLALLLGIAFGANIGGLGTLIGTPPNAFLAGYIGDRFEMQIGFAQWMAVGVPVSATMLVLAWWVLTRWAFPLPGQAIAGVGELIEQERRQIGPMQRTERRVAVVFVLTALAWVMRPWLESILPGAVAISDAGIALVGALALFLVPADVRRLKFLLDWEDTRGLPWGVLVLVGGGLALGVAIDESGLAGAIATLLSGMGDWPAPLLVLSVAVLAALMSHVTSNTATAATLLPLVTSLALTIGIHPLLLGVPVALAASAAFMLPVATPPNAIVFGSDRITVPDMVRAGVLLTFAGAGVATLAAFLLAPRVLGF